MQRPHNFKKTFNVGTRKKKKRMITNKKKKEMIVPDYMVMGKEIDCENCVLTLLYLERQPIGKPL